MDYSLSADQQAIIAAAEKICEKFGLDYWLDRDLHGGFPEDYFQEVARGGWLGIAMPEAYGGAGLGITEAALFLRTIASGGGALSRMSPTARSTAGSRPARSRLARAER